jgi:Transposase DNA-binding
MLPANYSGFLERRLDRRGRKLLSSLFKGMSSSIQRISIDRAEQIGYYRFLNNSAVGESVLIEEQKQRCGQLAAGKVVLCISDTTDVNFFSHANRLKSNSGLGYTAASKKGIGFKGHLCLAIDAKSFLPYGVADLSLWHREERQNKDDKEVYRYPIKEKESYRWIQGCMNSNDTLKASAAVIHIQDREGDIYEQLMGLPQDDNVFYIIRSSHNRAIEGEGYLYDRLSECKPIGTYELLLSGEGNSKQAKGIAEMEVKVLKTKLKRPRDKSAITKLPAYTNEITLIETKQVNATNNTAPICWRILTNCQIDTLADARQVVEWYTARWYVEELFKVIKKENFDIESSELETGWALRKLFSLLLDTAIKLFQFYIIREMEEGETLTSTSSFTKDEFKCLEEIAVKMEGKTEKQKNPYQKNSNHWVIWILARLGGWKGFASQRKPGMTTLIIGLEKFYNYYHIWAVQKPSG